MCRLEKEVSMNMLPTNFDARPVIIDILNVLKQYPMSYWHLDCILNKVKQEIDVSTPIVVYPKYESVPFPEKVDGFAKFKEDLDDYPDLVFRY